MNKSHQEIDSQLVSLLRAHAIENGFQCGVKSSDAATKLAIAPRVASRRLRALRDRGIVRSTSRRGYWTVAGDDDAARLRDEVEARREAESTEARAFALALGILRPEQTGDEDTDMENEDHNDEKMQHGFGVELTNSQFVALCKLAGIEA